MPLTAHAASERRLWGTAAAWLLLIYSTLYIARPITEWLRERNLLRLAVGMVFGLAAFGVVAWGRRRGLARRQWSVVFIAGAVTLLAVSLLRLPEERLHFVEYGLFAGLIREALGRRGAPRAGLWTVVVTALAGLCDELIQGILPNRYFGWRDVAMNAGAGTLVAMTFSLLERLRPTAE